MDNVDPHKTAFVNYLPEEMPRPVLAEYSQIGDHFVRGLPDL